MDKEYLIEKWLKDELSDAEKEAFKKLDDYQFNMDIIENAKHFKASHFSEINNYNVFKKRYDKQNTPVVKLNWVRPLLKIASVVVITLGIYFTFFFNNLTKVQTLASEKTIIELPDQSQVTLNALSFIKYNKRNWDDNRSLKLDGEAYFKVAKGKKFDIITHDGIVTVVGTQFNVKQRNNYFEVTCFEGVVRVSSDTITRQLMAGDSYRIINNIFSQNKTTSVIPSWTNNISSFEGVTIKEVVAELERQYNIRVTFKNVNTERLFSGGFIHNNLESALISITQPMNMTYELSKSGQVIIHGKKN
ncbi:FecR family protein [Yeosuana sp.]|uniref:FecR family protein n=1 Tax=Yeosuana sp. TaxID=2529388 RepID=UPI004054ED01